MENIISLYNNLIYKLFSKKIEMRSVWKIAVTIFSSLFVLVVVGGWVLYIYISTDSTVSIPVKTNRSEITMGDIDKVREIVNHKQNRMNEVIESEVNIKNLK